MSEFTSGDMSQCTMCQSQAKMTEWIPDRLSGNMSWRDSNYFNIYEGFCDQRRAVCLFLEGFLQGLLDISKGLLVPVGIHVFAGRHRHRCSAFFWAFFTPLWCTRVQMVCLQFYPCFYNCLSNLFQFLAMFQTLKTCLSNLINFLRLGGISNNIQKSMPRTRKRPRCLCIDDIPRTASSAPPFKRRPVHHVEVKFWNVKEF